jgi:hypothetical protein
MKIGDKVRILKKDMFSWSGCDDYRNEIGIVTKIHTDGTLTVHSENKEDYFGFFVEDELELIQKFKAGDRVRRSDGAEDVVLGVPRIPEYDGMDYAAPAKGFILARNNWEWQKDWTLIEEKEYNITKLSYTNMCKEMDYEMGVSTQYNKSLKETIMKNVVDFAKNMMITKEEKLLRKANLQDENGNWTESAVDIVKNLSAQEIGFKDARDASNKFENCGIGLSFLEIAQAFTKYQDKLIEIATEFEKENK